VYTPCLSFPRITLHILFFVAMSSFALQLATFSFNTELCLSLFCLLRMFYDSLIFQHHYLLHALYAEPITSITRFKLLSCCSLTLPPFLYSISLSGITGSLFWNLPFPKAMQRTHEFRTQGPCFLCFDLLIIIPTTTRHNIIVSAFQICDSVCSVGFLFRPVACCCRSVLDLF